MTPRPDLRTFTARHVEMAGDLGVRLAARNALAEAATWTYSQTVGRHRAGRERLIWEDDWDLCLVADACRFDLYRAVEPEYDWLAPGPSGWSAGSASPEWYGKTFDPDAMPDDRVGVVTANPFAAKPAHRVPVLANTPLHENPAVARVDYVFEESWGCDVENGYLDITHPSVVTDRAWRAWNEWDIDRLVVHYMQPHLPFRAHPEWFGVRHELDTFGERGGAHRMVGRDDGPYAGGGKEIWKELRDGQREYEPVWDAYADNLRWVLDDIDRLRRAVSGRLLLTSDHGNGLGEWGIWSHPPNIQIPALRRVPWVAVDGLGGRILEQAEVTDYDTGGRPVDEQLAALGYVD